MLGDVNETDNCTVVLKQFRNCSDYCTICRKGMVINMLGLQNYLKSKKKREAEIVSFQFNRRISKAESYLRAGMQPESVQFRLDLTKEELLVAQKRAVV